ncbi:MAG: acetyl-CoA C-acyltransferase [Gemmataceae bacterium]
MRSAVVVEAVRTPIARAHPDKGYFRDVRADDLSAHVIQALLEKARLPAQLVEDIHWGCVKQEKEQGYDIARQAVLIAGLPVEVGGCTVNRNCGSSLQAINQAAAAIVAGWADIVVAGGVEHMHHLPMDAGFDPSPRLFYRYSPADFQMGLTAEYLAQKYGITRREQDEFALRSHRRAAQATDSGEFAAEIVPTWGRDEHGRRCVVTQDQCIRRDTSLEALGQLKPAFLPEGGTITAGNASPINVGAAALLLMSEEKAVQLGYRPKVRIRAQAVAGVDPCVMGIGPVPAVHKVLQRAGVTLEQVDLVEINEAFAAQTLAVIKLLGVELEKVNVRGGAIAIGHPLGASGARISTTLIHLMEARKARYGLATMCIGGGQGIATLYEAVGWD